MIRCREGHTWCRKCIAKCSSCGLCRQELGSPIPNRAIHDLISQQPVRCLRHVSVPRQLTGSAQTSERGRSAVRDLDKGREKKSRSRTPRGAKVKTEAEIEDWGGCRWHGAAGELREHLCVCQWRLCSCGRSFLPISLQVHQGRCVPHMFATLVPGKYKHSSDFAIEVEVKQATHCNASYNVKHPRVYGVNSSLLTQPLSYCRTPGHITQKV